MAFDNLGALDNALALNLWLTFDKALTFNKLVAFDSSLAINLSAFDNFNLTDIFLLNNCFYTLFSYLRIKLKWLLNLLSALENTLTLDWQLAFDNLGALDNALALN